MTILKCKINKILIVLTALLLIINSNFGIWLNNTTIKTKAAPILGSTNIGGSNVLSIDKKYVRSGLESENISISPSSTFKVILKYDNTGSQSAVDAQIVDSIPAGFSYVGGSFKNCLTPSTTEQICDTMSSLDKNNSFGVLTGVGVSPSVGLYDTLTSPLLGGTTASATSGNLEIGKKRYINTYHCGFEIQRSIMDIDYSETRRFGNFGTATDMASNLPIFSTTPTSAFSECDANFTNSTTYAYYGQKVSLDTFGKRYINNHNCIFVDNTIESEINRFGDFGTSANMTTNAPTYSVGSYTPAGSDCVSSYPSNNPLPSAGNKVSLDTFGKRYINSHNCIFRKSSVDHNEVQRFGNFGTSANMTTNAPTYSVGSYTPTGSDCVSSYPSNNPLPGAGNKTSIDLLDTSRAKGYIEYELLAPSAIGQYGTDVTLRNSGSATSGNYITVNATDQYSSNINNTINIVPPIQNSDITGSCSPVSGLSGFISTCTINFSLGKTGNVNISAGTIGSCVINFILETETTRSCNITTSGNSGSYPVQYNASGSGSNLSNLGVSLNIETIDLSMRKVSDMGSDSQTNSQGTSFPGEQLQYTLKVKNNNLNYSTPGIITVRDVINTSNANLHYYTTQIGWLCNGEYSPLPFTSILVCTNTVPIPPNTEVDVLQFIVIPN